MSSKKTKKEKPKKNRSSKNLKISTRIFLTAILGILIPIILIGAFSPLLIYFTGSYFNISSVTTNSYSTVNQIQWSQTISSISNSLLSDENDKKKTESLSEFISPIERLGSSIYIEKNGKPFYSSSKSDILKEANEIVNVNKDENLNYFGNNGLVIVTHANSKSDKYLIVAVNKNYTVKNASTHYAAKEFTNLLLGRTGIIALIIVAVFVLAIVIISFITSKTIVNPIKKIADGADEIARGNLDYEIDYKSKNELGQTVESFNQMRLRLKNSIEKQNKADEQIRPNTKSYYTNYIENHIIPGIGDVPLDKLTTIQIQRFYNNLQKSGRVQRKNFPELKDKSLSPRVVRGVHTLLHNCLEQAVAERLILSNPAQGCKLPQLEKKDKFYRFRVLFFLPAQFS